MLSGHFSLKRFYMEVNLASMRSKPHTNVALYILLFIHTAHVLSFSFKKMDIIWIICPMYY